MLHNFARGFLITPEARAVELPALEGWTSHRHAGHVIRVHPDADLHVLETDGEDPSAPLRTGTWLLLGHAYDPWKGEPDERVLLEQLDAGLRRSDEAFLDALDRLSGRFVLFHFRSDGTGFAVQDAVGLKNLYFASTPEGGCFASHSQLLADALGLERDPDVDRLVESWFYGIGIRHLPGLRTPFRGMRMLSANTRLRLPDLTVERIFPRGPHPESDDLTATARIIDVEVRRIVTEGWEAARKILTEKAEDHEKLSQALLEYETLSGEEIKDLLEKGVAPNRDESSFPNSGPSVSVPITPVSDGVTVEAPSTVH